MKFKENIFFKALVQLKYEFWSKQQICLMLSLSDEELYQMGQELLRAFRNFSFSQCFKNSFPKVNSIIELIQFIFIKHLFRQ